ncbi:MAG: molybdopterin adenylyltransferase [Spirochaetota bacterium]
MITIAIITVSDRSSQGLREDLSGPEIKKWAVSQGYEVVSESIVPDEADKIKKKLIEYSDAGCDLILTTGGTGFAPRDVTPEATKAVIERETPGFGEAMRAQSLLITPHAMLSRATAGIRKQSIIINLPGSPKAVRENLASVEKAITHAVRLLKGKVADCANE